MGSVLRRDPVAVEVVVVIAAAAAAAAVDYLHLVVVAAVFCPLYIVQ